jgi:hypothetical protein
MFEAKFTGTFRLGERFYAILSNLAFYFQLDIVPNPKVEQFIYLQIDFEDKKINWRFFKFTNIRGLK